MVDAPGSWSTGLERHLPGCQDTLRAQMGCHHNTAGVHIKHDRPGEPAGAGWNRRDVRCPEPVGGDGCEHALHTIGDRHGGRIAVGGPAPMSTMNAHEVGPAPQPCHPRASTADPALPQLGVDPGRPIRPMTLGDAHLQPCVLRAPLPGSAGA